jgi:SAM-dependent methyltransferase
MTKDRDYILGTNDAEIARLGLQHRVWRPTALEFWRRAGITVGSTVIDAGCGPGYATIDLAEIVGPKGRVIAIDRSRRFLDVLRARAETSHLTNIEIIEAQLTDDIWPKAVADFIWCRWVYSFVREPAAIMRHMAAALKPGGTFVSQEYYDYRGWRLAPANAEFERFVQIIMQSWRDDGGEPDIGLDMVRFAMDAGLEVALTEPEVFITRPGDYFWEWPTAFVRNTHERLIELGKITKDDVERVAAIWRKAEADPRTSMFTPGVLMLAARKPG